jgi:hypothetical protein
VPEWISKGDALRAAVVDPLLWHLSGASRLILAPDGELCTISFAAFPSDRRGTSFLIDTYELSYIGIGRELVSATNVQELRVSPPLVPAGPDFALAALSGSGSARINDDPLVSRELRESGVHFSYLQGAYLEGGEVGRLLGVIPLLGPAALEGRIKAYHSHPGLSTSQPTGSFCGISIFAR